MKTNLKKDPAIPIIREVTIDQIDTTVEFILLLQDMIGKGGDGRVAHCSVSEVMNRDVEGKSHKEKCYTIGLYYGPFLNHHDIKTFTMLNPSWLCKRDVVQFIAHSLSHKKSPYFFNAKTGKFDHEMIVCG